MAKWSLDPEIKVTDQYKFQQPLPTSLPKLLYWSVKWPIILKMSWGIQTTLMLVPGSSASPYKYIHRSKICAGDARPNYIPSSSVLYYAPSVQKCKPSPQLTSVDLGTDFVSCFLHVNKIPVKYYKISLNIHLLNEDRVCILDIWNQIRSHTYVCDLLKDEQHGNT